MTQAALFPALDLETAPVPSRPLLKASHDQFGFIPGPVARVAASPALLRHLLSGFGAFDRTALTATEREVVAMTVAFENDCHYCMALHSALLAEKPALAPIVAALRAGTELPDARLEALRGFVRALVTNRGRVTREQLAELRLAGFSDADALDALLGTAVYITSTFANILTRADLDPPFEPFRWQKPGSQERF